MRCVAADSFVPNTDACALWRDRALDAEVALAAFDRLPIRIREDNGARAASLLFCLAVRNDGTKDVLGVWHGHHRDGWRIALTDLRRRGLRRARIVHGDFDGELDAATDRDLPAALRLQCLPHLMRRSLAAAAPKRRAALRASLTDIVRAGTESEGRTRLDRLAASRDGHNHPSIAAQWRAAWPWIAPHCELPAGVRRFLESFDASESLREKLARRDARLQICHRGEDAALHATAAALLRVATVWRVAPRIWTPAARYFGEAAVSRPRSVFERRMDLT